ncbi:MAG: MBL fold metallo-hydrolase [Anaerolineae bacterium]|nr:MBL fold metallo-hydrolase [Anaerolineae bacterium]
MLFERFESPGLAHYSYLIGEGHQAVVIDPRRDGEVYVQTAARAGMQITHILETHRNEDYVIGSVELAHRTGAVILHSAQDDLDYGYGERIGDGEKLRIGRLRLQALHTPGHTRGHVSYLLHDPSGTPWVLFSGDALFAGDVGRTDFYGRDKLDEMTGLLYESLFHKILPLGDEVIVCPAHGAGSACGTAIAERPWTTIGLERKLNPRLQYTNKDDFVAHVGRMLEYPPYFRMMEKLNLEGPPLLGSLPSPRPLSPREFARRAGDALVLDTRMELGFSSAHVPGALSIWEDGVPSFAGWFLTYDKPILLVTETNDVSQAVRYLIRLGYDRLDGFLAGGMLAWHKAGLPSQRLETVTVQDLCRHLDEGEDIWILDVRSDDEIQQAEIPNAHHIHVTELPQRLDEVPRHRLVYIFCGSGLRSMIAASLLQRAGWNHLAVVLGGLAGWSSTTCPLP